MNFKLALKSASVFIYLFSSCSCSMLGRQQYYQVDKSQLQERKDSWGVVSRNKQVNDRYIDRTYNSDGFLITAEVLASQAYSIGPIMIPVIPVFPFYSNQRAANDKKIELTICNYSKDTKGYSVPTVVGENKNNYSCKAHNFLTPDQILGCERYTCDFTVGDGNVFFIDPMTLRKNNEQDKKLPKLKFIYQDKIQYIWLLPTAP